MKQNLSLSHRRTSSSVLFSFNRCDLGPSLQPRHDPRLTLNPSLRRCHFPFLIYRVTLDFFVERKGGDEAKRKWRRRHVLIQAIIEEKGGPSIRLKRTASDERRKRKTITTGNNTSEKTITLKCSDGQEFEVPEAVAKVSPTICRIIEDDFAEGFILLPDNISATALAKVIEYCEKHASPTDASKTEAEAETTSNSKVLFGEDLENWDRQFLDMDPMMLLYDLGWAAYFLQIEELVDMITRKIADILTGKSIEEMRQTFKIINDFSPEEEEEIRREHHWAFH
ncbi:hypothetical protein LUZ63_003515 [Rhynchospora breviuscula]|uniref:SKP1-like protein n=1 Tax=Rhynchospora breviuscula TaxID=2022672 RepID=A0A9Q0HZ15_9POAL|nr:hypothetical protein LUZ63_003515 [Rhynchospora breviuscula]